MSFSAKNRVSSGKTTSVTDCVAPANMVMLNTSIQNFSRPEDVKTLYVGGVRKLQQLYTAGAKDYEINREKYLVALYWAKWVMLQFKVTSGLLPKLYEDLNYKATVYLYSLNSTTGQGNAACYRLAEDSYTSLVNYLNQSEKYKIQAAQAPTGPQFKPSSTSKNSAAGSATTTTTTATATTRTASMPTATAPETATLQQKQPPTSTIDPAKVEAAKADAAAKEAKAQAIKEAQMLAEQRAKEEAVRKEQERLRWEQEAKVKAEAEAAAKAKAEADAAAAAAAVAAAQAEADAKAKAEAEAAAATAAATAAAAAAAAAAQSQAASYDTSSWRSSGGFDPSSYSTGSSYLDAETNTPNYFDTSSGGGGGGVGGGGGFTEELMPVTNATETAEDVAESPKKKKSSAMPLLILGALGLGYWFLQSPSVAPKK